MSLAIKWGDDKKSASSGFIYFDAVTSKSVSYKGTVTSHPISKGSLISDHFVRDNTVVNFSGLVSGVDISVRNKSIPQTPDGRSPSNIRPNISAVKIEDDVQPFYKRIPLVGQFFNPSLPKIRMDVQPTDVVERVKLQIANLFQDGSMQLVSLYEYENNVLKTSPMGDLVMTSFSIQDDPEMMNVLRCDITLEQVQFSSLKKVKVPSEQRKILLDKDKVAAENATAASNESNKGAIPSTIAKAPEPIRTALQKEVAAKLKDTLKINSTASQIWEEDAFLQGLTETTNELIGGT